MLTLIKNTETRKRKQTERHRINKTFVESTTMPGEYRDDRLIGFCLRISPTGKKVFFVEATVRGARNGVSVKIGSTDRWTAESARQEAQNILHKMSQGINPNQERKRKVEQQRQEQAKHDAEVKAKSITVAVAFEDYKLSKQNLSAKTKQVYTYVLNDKLKEWLDLPLTSITSDMVEARHREISEKHKGDANHAMRVLRAIFEYAKDKYQDHVSKPLISKNPVRVLSRNKSWNKLPRRQTVIKSHQLKAWYHGVMALENTIVRDYLLLMLFTGLRKTAAASIEWTNVDLKDNTLKTIEKGNKEILLPIPNTVQRLLSERSNKSGKYVFLAENQSGYLKDIRYHIGLVTAASGVSFTLHDIRRTFATFAYQLCTHYEVKKLMSHADSTDVTSGYIVADVEQLRTPLKNIEYAMLMLLD